MARRRQKIWITRAQPGADATAQRVRALGHDALIAPLLAVRALVGVEVDLSGVAALAFTSANGVRTFSDICAERAIRVFAVGAATAQAARAAGFKLVLSADGDVDALAEGIGQRRGELRGAVLHPGASEPAGDLAGALEKQGVSARSLILYETAPVKLDDEAASQLVRADAVLLHSPRAAGRACGPAEGPSGAEAAVRWACRRRWSDRWPARLWPRGRFPRCPSKGRCSI